MGVGHENWDGQSCRICNKKIIEEDWNHQSAYDFSVTCKAHQEHAHVFNYEIVQLELGIIKELPDRYKKCDICNCDLSTDEINTLSKTDFTITCQHHGEVKKWFQLDIAKQWFEFKKEYPNAVYENETDRKTFHEWRKTRL